tara:strand:+ start:482 stop:916 length:435 start_codon:yes stop_codon:yes gene_type:complete
MVFGRPSPLYRQRLWRHFYFAQSATFLRGVYTKLGMQKQQAGGKTTTLLINETTVLVKRYITKKLCFNGAAKGDVDLCISAGYKKGLKNQLKNSQLPFRRREKAMQGFRSTDSSSGLYQSTVTFKIVSLYRPAPRRPHNLISPP